jgi:hypothetical protein
MNLYHTTGVDNLPSIYRYGLRPGDKPPPMGAEPWFTRFLDGLPGAVWFTSEMPDGVFRYEAQWKGACILELTIPSSDPRLKYYPKWLRKHFPRDHDPSFEEFAAHLDRMQAENVFSEPDWSPVRHNWRAFYLYFGTINPSCIRGIIPFGDADREAIAEVAKAAGAKLVSKAAGAKRSRVSLQCRR